MQDLKELNEVITAIKEEIRQGADALTTSKSVYEFKKTFLDNKQGRIGLLMKEMRNVANDQKAEFGKTINGAKEWANNFFDELDQKLKEKEQQQRYESEKIDITMPPVKIRYGNLHPVTTVRNPHFFKIPPQHQKQSVLYPVIVELSWLPQLCKQTAAPLDRPRNKLREK
mgnify:CR=1 FL=1